MLVGNPPDHHLAHGGLAARMTQAGDDLLANVGLARAILLDNRQARAVFRPLVGRIPLATKLALTATADHSPALAATGVHDLVVILPAIWTLHRHKPQRQIEEEDRGKQ